MCKLVTGLLTKKCKLFSGRYNKIKDIRHKIEDIRHKIEDIRHQNNNGN